MQRLVLQNREEEVVGTLYLDFRNGIPQSSSPHKMDGCCCSTAAPTCSPQNEGARLTLPPKILDGLRQRCITTCRLH